MISDFKHGFQKIISYSKGFPPCEEMLLKQGEEATQRTMAAEKRRGWWFLDTRVQITVGDSDASCTVTQT